MIKYSPLDLLVWRLVFSEYATLNEVESCYSIEDILIANEILTDQIEVLKKLNKGR